MSDMTSNQEYNIQDLLDKFKNGIGEYFKNNPLPKKRSMKLLKVKRSFTVNSRRWNKNYLSNYLSKH